MPDAQRSHWRVLTVFSHTGIGIVETRLVVGGWFFFPRKNKKCGKDKDRFGLEIGNDGWKMILKRCSASKFSPWKLIVVKKNTEISILPTDFHQRVGSKKKHPSTKLDCSWVGMIPTNLQLLIHQYVLEGSMFSMHGSIDCLELNQPFNQESTSSSESHQRCWFSFIRLNEFRMCWTTIFHHLKQIRISTKHTPFPVVSKNQKELRSHHHTVDATQKSAPICDIWNPMEKWCRISEPSTLTDFLFQVSYLSLGWDRGWRSMPFLGFYKWVTFCSNSFIK